MYTRVYIRMKLHLTIHPIIKKDTSLIITLTSQTEPPRDVKTHDVTHKGEREREKEKKRKRGRQKGEGGTQKESKAD